MIKTKTTSNNIFSVHNPLRKPTADTVLKHLSDQKLDK